MHRTTSVWLACLMVLMSVAAGCRAAPASNDDPIGAVPADLTIDLTILAGRHVPEATEVHLHPARLVLYADGSLHFSSDRQPRVDSVPGLTRRLSREQMAEIWSLARRLGLADADAADEMVNFRVPSPRQNERLYLLGMRAQGEHWAFIRRYGIDEDVHPALAQFIRTLGRMAWAAEIREEEPLVIPKRYDFGPDPYARYRRE